MPLEEEARQWLQDEGVDYPDTDIQSRWPTPNELRSVLESLPGYSVSYRSNGDGGWDAEIVDQASGLEGWHATIWTKRAPDDATPNEFHFHKPSLELALLILERLSHICGPFVLVDDSSVIPVVVTPGADLAVLTARYD